MALVLSLHSSWRWIVLLFAVLAVVSALASRSGDSPAWANRLIRNFPVVLDIQVLLGLILWIGGSAWQDNLFIAVIHPLGMLLALGIAHMGGSRDKKAVARGTPRTATALLYLASLAVVVATIPVYSWTRF